MINSFDSAALRLVDAKLQEWLTANADSMAVGTDLVPENASATAQNYAQHVGYCKALRDIKGLLEQVEEDLKRS